MNAAILVAVFGDHATAQHVRTQLVNDGFPTDRVELTSREELGQVKLVPRGGVGEKLIQYFTNLFHNESEHQAAESAQLFRHAVLEGKAVVAVHPRGDVETKRALQLLNDGGPIEMRSADLQNQPLERAAAEGETPVLTWMGKVLAAPGARDTTGTARLP